MADSANDPEIEPILDQVYEEINYALIHGWESMRRVRSNSPKRQKRSIQTTLIVDLVDRIARDPIRKLGPQDRFIGPMKIALGGRNQAERRLHWVLLHCILTT